MDTMLLGETIASPGGDLVYYGDWESADGNDGVAAVEVFRLNVANAFAVHLETKSSDEDDGAASGIGSVVLSSTTPQVYKFDVTNAKDLVRYKVVSQEDAPSYLHVQFAQPSWAPN